MFGRGSFEDFELKGYDIIGKAVALLERKFELTFVGAVQDEQRKVEKWFLEETKISRNQLTIRGFCSYGEIKRMYREADLIVIPSRTEGFGLVGGHISWYTCASLQGMWDCKALRTVDSGMAVVIALASPEEWANRIQQLSKQTADERSASAVHLRENYGKKYNWKEESEKFEKMILQLAPSPTPKEIESTEKAASSLNETMETRKKESLTVLTATGDVPHSSLEVGKTERNKQRESSPGNVLHSSLEAGKTEGNEQRESAPARPKLIKTDEETKRRSGFLKFIIGKFIPIKGTKLQERQEDNKSDDVPHSSLEVGRTERNEQREYSPCNIPHSSLEAGKTEGNKQRECAPEKVECRSNEIERTRKKESLTVLTAADSGTSAYDSTEKTWSNKKEVFTATEKPPNTSLKSKRTDRNERAKSVKGLSVDSKDAEGTTPLMNAAVEGNIQAVERLIKRGADPSLKNNRGWNLLHFAAEGGDTDVIDLIHTHLPDIESKTAQGDTPLMVAAYTGKLHAVKWFLEKGANVTSVDNNGWNMLHCATKGGDTDVIDLIHTHLLDIESQTASGATPLIIAVLHGKLQGVKSLLEKGANPLAKDNGGKDSLHYASSRDVDFLDLLLSHVANNDNRH